MRSRHRAPLVAYAIVAIVGLVVIMQTVSPDVMALQRVPRSLVGHGAYRVEDPPAPIAPRPLVPSGSSTPSTSSSSGARGGESHADPAGTTTPVAQHQPPRGGLGSQGGVPQAPSGTTPPGQTPTPAPLPEPTYLLPPIGPLPGVPAPPLVSDLVDGLLPDAATPATASNAGKARQGQGKNGSGSGANVATKAGDRTGSGPGQTGKQTGDTEQDEQPALRRPVRTLAALTGQGKAAAGRAGPDDGCSAAGKDAGKDAGDEPGQKAPVATLGNVLEGAGIDPAPADDPATEPATDPATALSAPTSSSAAEVGGKGAACDDGCSSPAGAQRKQSAQKDAGAGTCASAEAQQDHSQANAHHAGK